MTGSETGLRYQISKMNGETHVVGFLGDQTHPPIGKDHPYFERIIDALLKDNPEKLSDEEIFGLFNIPASLKAEFAKLSDRVAIEHGSILYEGEPMHGAVVDQILKTIDENGPIAPIVNFFEKIMLNPQDHSREQLYRWLDKHDFDLIDDGDIIVYKGCNYQAGGAGGGTKIVSSHSGNEDVVVTDANGDTVKVTGLIPQPIGGVVEMARSIVNHNPSQGCSVGLHVGTLSYAQTFGKGPLLKCVVSPRDVVSVPTDSSERKMRVCRYRIIEELNREDGSPKNPAPVDTKTPYVPPADDVADDTKKLAWWKK